MSFDVILWGVIAFTTGICPLSPWDTYLFHLNLPWCGHFSIWGSDSRKCPESRWANVGFPWTIQVTHHLEECRKWIWETRICFKARHIFPNLFPWTKSKIKIPTEGKSPWRNILRGWIFFHMWLKIAWFLALQKSVFSNELLLPDFPPALTYMALLQIEVD